MGYYPSKLVEPIHPFQILREALFFLQRYVKVRLENMPIFLLFYNLLFVDEV